MNDPLFITRKRKKWKFHHFNEWQNCWQADEVKRAEIKKFIGDKKLTVEIGAGTADLAVELARRYPDERFIACDIKSDRLYTGAKQALAEKLDNVCFLRLEMRKISEVLPDHIADTVWITFPDPYPRKKHAKHRLTHPTFLKMYQQLLKPGGVLYFKTDNQKLFDWSVEQFEAEGWKLKDITRNLHDSKLHDDFKITTAFERRFMAEGQPMHFLQANAQ